MQINFAQVKPKSMKGSRTEALKKPAYSSSCCWEQGGEAEAGSIAIGRHHPHPQRRHCSPRLLLSPLYLHNILHLHGAGLCVLQVAGAELGEVKDSHCVLPKLLHPLITTAL